MNTMLLRLFATALAALLLGACSSTPPTQYYVLSADAPPGAHGVEPSVGILELDVAEYLRYSEMLVMQTPNQLRMRDYHRWAEPLDQGIQRTLALDLGALLGSDNIKVRPWPREWHPQWLLRVDVARLDVTESNVELVAFWTLVRGAETRERSSRLSRARSGDSADSVAADVSRLVLDLSEQIASEIRGATVRG